jgi:hypothetical protein
MISLRHNVDAAIMWVERKMQEETRFKELAERHPAVADAIDHLKEAEARLRVVTALVEKETKA